MLCTTNNQQISSLQKNADFSGHTMKDTNVCDGIKVGDEVAFEVTLEATHCVEQRDFDLKIGPSGLDETLAVDVHVLCDCDCETDVCVSPLSAAHCLYLHIVTE